MDYLKYLFYFVEDADANTDLIKKYKDIEMDLVSSKDNPNCSCRGRVWDYFINKFREEKEDSINFFKELYEKNVLIKLRIDSAENNAQFIRTIHIIDNNEQSWNLFQDKLNSINYRTISIIENQNKLKIFLT